MKSPKNIIPQIPRTSLTNNLSPTIIHRNFTLDLIPWTSQL